MRHEAVNVNVGSSGPHGYSTGKALRWEQWLQQGQEEGGRAQVWQTGLGSLRLGFSNLVSKDLGGGGGRCEHVFWGSVCESSTFFSCVFSFR